MRTKSKDVKIVELELVVEAQSGGEKRVVVKPEIEVGHEEILS